METTTKKVKCLLCEASFTKKATRMLSHLGYEGPYGICDKGVLCAEEQHRRSKGSSTKAVVFFSYI